MSIVHVDDVNVGIIYGLRLNCPGSPYRYVGLTTKTAAERFTKHKANAADGLCYPVYRWMRKHGLDAIACDVLEQCADSSLLSGREAWWIAELQTFAGFSPSGLNCTLGGETGYFSPEVLLAMTAKVHAYWSDPANRQIHSEKLIRYYSTTPNAKEENRLRVLAFWTEEARATQSELVKQSYVDRPEKRIIQANNMRITNHKRWHTDRSIIKLECEYCLEALLSGLEPEYSA